MCRIYRSRAGWYVRLCYVHGDHKGKHVPVPEGYELPGRHYPRQHHKRRSGAKDREPVRRCIFCGAPLSRHNTTGICSFCTEHPETRPPGDRNRIG